MFDQLLIHTMARKSQITAPNSKSIPFDEKKIRRANKNSTILEKFCMHAVQNRSQDHPTSRNPNINVLPSSEIENIKKRLDQKLLHDRRKHSPVDRSCKINEFSSTSIFERVSRISYQDCVIRTSSTPAQVPGRSVLSGSNHSVMKKEKKPCPRCGRWCKFYCRSATTSSSVVVCVNCGKRFQPFKKVLDKPALVGRI